MYQLTREQLLADLHEAFQGAKRHKSKKVYVQRFEWQLERNLQVLCDELWNRTYHAWSVQTRNGFVRWYRR